MGKRVVLSVEDDDAAFHLLKTAFEEGAPTVELVRVQDGDQALSFLERRGQFQNAPRPDLVLLNINLPKKSGLEVLTEVTRNDSLRSIPVVIFTSSSLQAEKARCMALGAQDFLTKPSSFDGLVAAVRSVCAPA